MTTDNHQYLWGISTCIINYIAKILTDKPYSIKPIFHGKQINAFF